MPTVSPAVTVACPPTPLFPELTDAVIAPPVPVDPSPDTIDINPPFPSDELPVLICIVPLLPELVSLLEPDVMLIDPSCPDLPVLPINFY